MVIEYCLLPEQKLASVAATVKLNVPEKDGVPEITPVDGFRANPGGK